MPRDTPSSKSDLRVRAQAQLDNLTQAESASRTSVETQRLLHELQVHQLELEMQNDELQRSRSEVELVLSRYTDLYDFAPVSYFTVDRSGSIVLTNLAGGRLLGADRHSVYGKRFAEFLVEKDMPGFSALVEQVFATRHHQVTEVSIVSPDTAQRALQIDAMLSPDGRTCCMSVIDITDRRELEKTRDQAAALALDHQVAQAASQAKSAFMSRMSHELRTPLNAIMGFTQLLQMDEHRLLDDEQAKRLGVILAAGTHLLRLVEDVLDLSSIESGTVRLVIEPIKVQLVLDAAVQLVSPALRASGLTLTHEHLPASAAQDAFVLADKTRLIQVMVNLLTNAIKYNSAAGSVRIIVDTTQSGITRLAVVDTGCGMSTVQLSNIFEPFNRLGQEQSGTPGTGIGLVITKWLVDMMGGRLAVQSETGKGSRFDVLLPSAIGP